jgi:hypothetical protein
MNALEHGKFWTDPLPSALSEQDRDPLDVRLSSALSAACRGPEQHAAAMARALDRPMRCRDVLDLMGGGFELPGADALDAARAGLETLERLLGPDGAVADVSSPGARGAPVALRELRARIDEAMRAAGELDAGLRALRKVLAPASQRRVTA